MLNQNITHPKPNQTAKVSQLPITITAQAPKISVHCDLCNAYSDGIRQQLQADGWGIYQRFAFCPMHEEMI